jgi:uncharacterized membrane protein (UPF0127 family)
MIGRGFLAALFLFSTTVVSAQDNPVRPTTELVVSQIGGKKITFDVELALTNQQRSLGLMYRTELAPDRGMLFIFPGERLRSFWMRNTLIPLDIIFLDADGSIINIVANAEPRTETQRRSTAPAKAVFEIIGGRAAELGLKPGDIVRHALLGNTQSSPPAVGR